MRRATRPRLEVLGLTDSVTEMSFANLMSCFGHLVRCDAASGIVEYAQISDAVAAIDSANGMEFQGNVLTVRFVDRVANAAPPSPPAQERQGAARPSRAAEDHDWRQHAAEGRPAEHEARWQPHFLRARTSRTEATGPTERAVTQPRVAPRRVEAVPAVSLRIPGLQTASDRAAAYGFSSTAAPASSAPRREEGPGHAAAPPAPGHAAAPLAPERSDAFYKELFLASRKVIRAQEKVLVRQEALAQGERALAAAQLADARSSLWSWLFGRGRAAPHAAHLSNKPCTPSSASSTTMFHSPTSVPERPV